MSRQIELFIESIVQEIKIDEVQRERIRETLRSRLTELVSVHENHGFKTDAAEREAIRRLNIPRNPGDRSCGHAEQAWQYFNLAATALFMTIVLIMMPGSPMKMFHEWWAPPVIFALIMALGWHSRGGLAGCLTIDGGLRIRRYFRRDITIPFERLRSVNSPSMHLWGTVKNHYFEHEDGIEKVSANIRGLQIALIALEALAPEILDAKLKERMGKRLLTARPETWFFRLTVSIVWLCGAAVVLNWMPILWIGEAYPRRVMAALVFPALAAAWQYKRHLDSARKGFAALLATATTGAMFAMFGGFLHGNFQWIHWPLIAALSAFVMALPVIWWRGPRWGLAVLAGIVMLGAVFAPRWSLSLLPQIRFVKEQNQLTYSNMAEGFLEDFAVLGPNEIVWILDGFTEPSLLMYQHDDSITTHTLGTGSGITTLIPPPPDALISVLRLGSEDENYRTFIDSLLPDGSLRHEDWLTSPVQFQPTLDNQDSLWSPDGRHVRASDDGLVVAENGTGRVIYRAEGLNVGRNSAWIDNRRIRAVDIVSPDHMNLDEFGREPGIYVYEIDTAEKTTELKLRFDFAPYTLFTGLEYCVIGGDRVNLTTGERLALPGWEGPTQASAPAWHGPTHRLAFATRRVRSVGDDEHEFAARELIVIDDAGEVIARRTFRLGQRILFLEFSPDGRKMSMIRSAHDARLGMSRMFSNAFTEIWNLESGEIHIVAQQGAIRAILISIAESSRPSHYRLPEWAPDSSELLHPFMVVDYGPTKSSTTIYNTIWKATLPKDGE